MSAATAAPAEPEIPEAGQVADFSHPRSVSVLFGHGAAERTLLGAARTERLHHAWLLTGPAGIGKATLAYRFARFLLTHPKSAPMAPAHDLSVDPESAVMRQVAAGTHPGLLVLRRPWDPKRKRHASAITINEARRLRPFLGQTAAGGTRRIVIIDSADEMNLNAANAVLKSLEEPPAACLFLLLASAPGRLPATVRSRCRTLKLQPLAEDDLKAAVEAAFETSGAAAPDAEDLALCLALGQGSPGQVLRLLALEGAALYRGLTGLMKSLPRVDQEAVHALADALAAPGAADRYELFHGLLGDLIARLVAHGANAGAALEGEGDLAARLGVGGALAYWAGLWETLQRAKAEADALNLDRKTLVLETFFRLEKAVQRLSG